MTAGALTWLSVPVALIIGMIGAVSVFKAVYIDKRELKCVCVGGDINVPLGFISTALVPKLHSTEVVGDSDYSGECSSVERHCNQTSQGAVDAWHEPCKRPAI